MFFLLVPPARPPVLVPWNDGKRRLSDGIGRRCASQGAKAGKQPHGHARNQPTRCACPCALRLAGGGSTGVPALLQLSRRAHRDDDGGHEDDASGCQLASVLLHRSRKRNHSRSMEGASHLLLRGELAAVAIL